MKTGLAVMAMASAVAMSVPAWAQDKALSREEAAAAFGAREKILDASLSPDGGKVAMVVPGPEQSTVVQVLDIATNSAKPINFADGDPMTLTGCGWVSNARLVCSLYGVSNRNGPMLAYSRLIAMDADGGNAMALAAMQRVQQYAQQSDGYVLDWRDGSTNQVLLARRYVPAANSNISVGSKARGLGVDLFDTVTGESEMVESSSPWVLSYIADGTGKVRIMATDESLRRSYTSSGEITFSYRMKDSRDWKPFSVYNSVTKEGLYPISVDGKANVAYALKKTDGRDALYRVALDGSMKAELAYAHPQVDVSGVIRVGRQGRVVAATYALERRQAHYFDPEYAAMVEKLGRALPKTPVISIVDSSADGKKHLVFAASDTDPGHYFYFDSEKRSLFGVGLDRPQLAGVTLAKHRPITFTATDGTVVPGYLTLPPGSDGKKLPAIVLPHGGPAARDEWGFDWLVQFFANRGYAVLQPNFRGSSGYGDAWFQENGFRSWKIAISDVVDAGRWLIKEGIADPSKLAIVGWSYGGYAALQSNALDPDLFKAVVAIAPVTDLEMLRSEQRGFTNMRIAQDYIGEGPQLEEGSPTNHAARFKAPVLMFHGEKDINVNVDESKAMDKALRRAGKESELVIYPDIDHQLRDSAVRTDMLTKADAFLAEALGR